MDPAVTDGFAYDREVILFNNAGVSSSSGEVPTTFEKMGANAVAFIKALGPTKVDVLGFSIGGFVAQEITLQAPGLVRKLLLHLLLSPHCSVVHRYETPVVVVGTLNVGVVVMPLVPVPPLGVGCGVAGVVPALV